MYFEITDQCMVNDYIESFFVKITNNGMVFVIGLIYRPQTPILFNLLKLEQYSWRSISHASLYDGWIQYWYFETWASSTDRKKLLRPWIQFPYYVWFSNQPRETETTATLIDNIFINKYNINDNILQGIFASDISVHYMIFHISDKCAPDIEECQLIKLINECRMLKFKKWCLWYLWVLFSWTFEIYS